MGYITVSNIAIEVVRKDIKNIHLAVYPPSGRVRIAAPSRITDDAIRLFAVSKIGWIKRNQRKLTGQERLPQPEYKYRESHYFRGHRYLLNIIEVDAAPKVVIRNKTYLDLYVRPNSSFEKRHEVMTEWYREQLKMQIPSIIAKWEKKMKVEVDDWQVKQMKTKWGSCNREKKRIWINLELAKKPEQLLEYIIVHELAHLKERHHNERFQAIMDKYLPNWKQLKTALNRLPVNHVGWEY